MQNEPMARQKWDSCVFRLEEQKTFIYKYLLPKLKNTKILLWDHNKDNLYQIFKYLYEDNPKIGGLAFHYYTGKNFDEIKKIRKENLETLLINSEMCCGYYPYDEQYWLKDAEYYLNDIIGDMNSGVNAYLDWNILLDEYGGPTPYKNYVKSVLVLKGNNFFKTPIYYYLYHISHFLKGDDTIIENVSSTENLQVVSLKNKEEIIVVIMNSNDEKYDYDLVIGKDKYFDTINPHSIITYQCHY